VPDELIERAKAAHELRSPWPVVRVVSGMIAEPGGEQRLRLEHEPVHVELAVRAAGARRDMRGRVQPPQLRVEVELEGSPVTVAEGATRGEFAFEGVPRGVMRLPLVRHEGAWP
jgi:hypothetical protein